MVWSPLSFGKYEGKTLPQVIFLDPDWFFWTYENKGFEDNLIKEANEIYQKARAIKVPQSGGEKKVVEYVIHKPTDKFGTIRLLTYKSGMNHLNISHVIDFKFPRTLIKYDKTGYKNFIFALKFILFGDSKYRMTKKRSEKFFDNKHNFVSDKEAVLTI